MIENEARDGQPSIVTLHIERLIVDGIDIASGQRHLLIAAVETELGRLLSEGGVAPQLTNGGALARIVSPAIQLKGGDGPAQLGRQIAGAVYGGIGK